jgi:hypothetical protein
LRVGHWVAAGRPLVGLVFQVVIVCHAEPPFPYGRTFIIIVPSVESSEVFYFSIRLDKYYKNYFR